MSSEETAGEGRRPRKLALRLGGLLTVVIGLLALQNGVQAMTAEGDTSTSQYLAPGAVCGTAIMFFGIMAVAGGICALMAKHFSLALAGALLGMMGGGWLSFALGLTAFVLYFFADEDF